MPAPEHQAELLAALKYQPGLRPLAMTRPKRPPAHSFCFVPSRIGFQPRCHQQRRPKKLKTNGSRAAQNRYLIAYILSFRSEEHTSELQSHVNLVCRLLLEKKKKHQNTIYTKLI